MHQATGALRTKEVTLAVEARERGFNREAERHECTRKRIEQLLDELGKISPALHTNSPAYANAASLTHRPKPISDPTTARQ